MVVLLRKLRGKALTIFTRYDCFIRHANDVCVIIYKVVASAVAFAVLAFA